MNRLRIFLLFCLLSLAFFAPTILFPVAAEDYKNVRSPYEKSFEDFLVEGFGTPEAFSRSGASFVLFEQETGTVLASHLESKKIPPASLTKLMTLYLVQEYLEKNDVDIHARFEVSPGAWAANAPPHSSLMFLGPDQNPNWEDLLLGLAVSSGNDAGVAAAERVSGSLESFVELMNAKAAELGLRDTRFTESFGYSENNVTTARDYAYLIHRYLERFPQALEKLHAVKTFVYPYLEGTKKIAQQNRNYLLGVYPGLDGLKTGYIDESGYNFAFTAKREELRLSGVILGSKSEAERFDLASKLLDYGFDNFSRSMILVKAPGPVRLWHAEQGTYLPPDQRILLLLPKAQWDTVSVKILIPEEVYAPFSFDTVLGSVEVETDTGKSLARFPYRAGREIKKANPVMNTLEDAYLFFRRLFGQPDPSAL